MYYTPYNNLVRKRLLFPVFIRKLRLRKLTNIFKIMPPASKKSKISSQFFKTLSITLDNRENRVRNGIEKLWCKNMQQIELSRLKNEKRLGS